MVDKIQPLGLAFDETESTGAARATALKDLRESLSTKANLIPDLSIGLEGWEVFDFVFESAWNGVRLRFSGTGRPLALTKKFAAFNAVDFTFGINKIDTRAVFPMYVSIEWSKENGTLSDILPYAGISSAVDANGRTYISSAAPSDAAFGRGVVYSSGVDTGYLDITNVDVCVGSSYVFNPIPSASLEELTQRAQTTIILNIGDETTPIATGAAKKTFRMPHGFYLSDIRASLTTASSSGIPTIDINKGGASILATRITIDATERTSFTAATPPVISDRIIANDAEMTINIDVAGTGAAGLKVYLIGWRT